MRQLLAAALAALTFMIATAAPLRAQQAPAGASTPIPAEKPDPFGERVRTYLLSHPEVIMEAVQLLQERQKLAEAESQKQAITVHAGEIFHDPTSPVWGNTAGDVTLVEFFDYNCKYCRAVDPTIVGLQDADPMLRLAYKEFPILGAGSLAAAKVALAAQRQGKYHELHQALMSATSSVDGDTALQAAKALGLDVDRLKRDMGDPAIAETIARNQALAGALGINGTPSFVVADQVVPGAADRATFEGLISQARGSKPAKP